MRAEFYHRIPRLIQKAESVPSSCLHGVQKKKIFSRDWSQRGP